MSGGVDGSVEAARRFTRAFTRETELLNESLHGSSFGLTESRILYELAHRTDATAVSLSRELGIDPGYLSRTLKRFADGGLLKRSAAPNDGRRQQLALTREGRDAFAPLDRASREAWERRLAGLTDGERSEVTAAMGRIERLLALSAEAGPVEVRPYRVGDLGAVAQRQGLLYAREYGWDATYEALVAEILAAFVRSHDPVSERAWIAERHGTMLGSCFLMRASETVAKLRLLYVEPEARGMGLGASLVRTCIDAARGAGYETLTLWTNDCLIAARAIYQRAGFVLVAEDKHHSFGQNLVGQTWSLDLTG